MQKTVAWMLTDMGMFACMLLFTYHTLQPVAAKDEPFLPEATKPQIEP